MKKSECETPPKTVMIRIPFKELYCIRAAVGEERRIMEIAEKRNGRLLDEGKLPPDVMTPYACQEYIRACSKVIKQMDVIADRWYPKT